MNQCIVSGTSVCTNTHITSFTMVIKALSEKTKYYKFGKMHERYNVSGDHNQGEMNGLHGLFVCVLCGKV